MTLEYWLGLFVSLAIAAYVFYALLKPERF
jgi:K+-transporting ATPase KdpF subunit